MNNRLLIHVIQIKLQQTLLIADGVSNVLPQNTVPEAKKAQRDGIQIYAVGIDLGATEELFTIVSDRKNNVLLVPNFDHLQNNTDEFLNKLCKPLDNTIPLLSDAAADGDSDLSFDGKNFSSLHSLKIVCQLIIRT